MVVTHAEAKYRSFRRQSVGKEVGCVHSPTPLATPVFQAHPYSVIFYPMPDTNNRQKSAEFMKHLDDLK